MWSLLFFVVVVNICTALACPAASVVGQGYQGLRRNPGAIVALHDLKDTHYYDTNESGLTDFNEPLKEEEEEEESRIEKKDVAGTDRKDVVTEDKNVDEGIATEPNADGEIEAIIAEVEEVAGDAEVTTNADGSVIDGEEATIGNNEEISRADGIEDTTIDNGEEIANAEEKTNGNDEDAAAVFGNETTAQETPGGDTDSTKDVNKQTRKPGHYRTSTRCTLNEDFDIPSAEATTNGTLEVADTTPELTSQAQSDDEPPKINLTETTVTISSSTTTRAPYVAPKNEFTETIFIDDH